MTLTERLAKVKRIFLDTAPVIYWVERHAAYAELVRVVLDRVDDGSVIAVTSPVTLAECLVHPVRAGRLDVARAFTDLIAAGPNTVFVPIDREVACRAAELRAQHNLSLADAFQIAVATGARCDAFLTNDSDLARVPGIDVIVLHDLVRGEQGVGEP